MSGNLAFYLFAGVVVEVREGRGRRVVSSQETGRQGSHRSYAQRPLSFVESSGPSNGTTVERLIDDVVAERGGGSWDRSPTPVVVV